MSEAANRLYAIKNRHGDYVALLRSREEAETFEGGLWDGDTIEEIVPSTALLSERKETIERCAKASKDWLEDWGSELDHTSVGYRDAAVSGVHNGRRIQPDFARKCALAFKERADAVYDCGEQVAAALRSLGRE